MSESIFETSTDERGNISVRVSQDVQVLTLEEADRIEAEYERMQAENAKLREELDAAKHDLSIFSGRIVELDAENAKLRELVRSMYDVLDVTIDWSELDDEMRELGIEVDDA